MKTRLIILSQFALILSAALALNLTPLPAHAESVVEIPALAAGSSSPDDLGVFSIKMLWWDQRSDPNPLVLKWGGGRVNSWQYGHAGAGGRDQSAAQQALDYAIKRTPSVTHTGTVRIQGIAYRSAMFDGPSAGAVMAVGFIAMFKGESLQRGIALTGTLDGGGRIGAVGGLPGKIRAAAREDYHTILIPFGQLSEPRWNLRRLALELGVAIREVRTVDEAYRLMTGRRI